MNKHHMKTSSFLPCGLQNSIKDQQDFKEKQCFSFQCCIKFAVIRVELQVHRKCHKKETTSICQNWTNWISLYLWVPKTQREHLPGLHASRSRKLHPVLWVRQGQSSGNRHWRSVPGHEQALLPDRTVPQAGPSATLVTETGNGLASL